MKKDDLYPVVKFLLSKTFRNLILTIVIITLIYLLTEVQELGYHL